MEPQKLLQLDCTLAQNAHEMVLFAETTQEHHKACKGFTAVLLDAARATGPTVYCSPAKCWVYCIGFVEYIEQTVR
jgi:hypothetical protein